MNFLKFFYFAAPALASVNMYISKEEMNRTLGVKAELNYIENGNVNSYSTKFHYRVMSKIDHVSFTWNAEGAVEYDVRAESDDSSVLPIVRIPLKGTVPNHYQEFNIEYRCAGHRSGQFTISIFFHFYYNDTVLPLRLKQEKICESKDGRRGLTGAYDGFEFEEEGSIDRVFFFIIFVAAAFLLIVAAALICYFKRAKKEECPAPQRLPTSFRASMKFTKAAQPFIRSQPSASSSVAIPSSVPCSVSSTYAIFTEKPRNIDIRKALVALYQDREQFQALPFIDMEGTFGEVRFAIWRQPDDIENGDIDDEEDAVCNQEAVYTKTLKKNASTVQLDRFLSDSLAFYGIIPHPNLAQVACAASFGRFDRPDTMMDFPLICYRHQGFGNLKKFLANCKHGDKAKGAQTLRTHQLVAMGLQISSALAHLHKHGIVHTDVATRNCLVAEVNNRLQVQLCDSALSRDLFASDYHCLGDNENRPLKWMSPEAIAAGTHTSASDVWSLGVLLWELMTLGGTPFTDVDPEDVYSMLTKGIRLAPPGNCPEQMYKVMLCCWRSPAEDRPSAAQVVQGLQDFTVQLSQFI
ncbi:unnamed protein product [Caenorhabditis auriculariae]|uniref:Protein kinase domain-containing protein n=1 Tax=Caenorhabditis auriculariae TaxID=2777116 RepID=A0A8S1GRF1_9PELO|nr:unnamed protein product [Caenorhabditis auriculariae]